MGVNRQVINNRWKADLAKNKKQWNMRQLWGEPDVPVLQSGREGGGCLSPGVTLPREKRPTLHPGECALSRRGWWFHSLAAL